MLERHERTAKAGVVLVTLKGGDGREETLTVTANHPYLRADNGDFLRAVKLDPGGTWSAAGKLAVGDKVQAGAGETLEVVKVETVDLSQHVATVVALEKLSLKNLN